MGWVEASECERSKRATHWADSGRTGEPGSEVNVQLTAHSHHTIVHGHRPDDNGSTKDRASKERAIEERRETHTPNRPRDDVTPIEHSLARRHVPG